jgi:hypothetical protein
MRSNTLTLSLVVALALATLSACDKHGKKSDEAATPATTNAAVATAPATTVAPAAATPAAVAPGAGGEVSGGKKAWKLACADDLKKFCADADKPGRCLKKHEGEISQGCKTAREEAKAARKAGKADKAE